MNYINSKNELYDKCENMEELYDRYYLYLLSQYELTVSENQKLKKQLEEKENQQKDFIEYLDCELNVCDGFLDTIKNDLEEISYVGRISGKTYIATQIVKNESTKKCYKEILSKYKEIIGCKYE